eukprot:m.70961 g.70961  ORF g.70961 m.70961 type:complete len:420 (+) comp14333_c0_seq1:65-1324(+)
MLRVAAAARRAGRAALARQSQRFASTTAATTSAAPKPVLADDQAKKGDNGGNSVPDTVLASLSKNDLKNAVTKILMETCVDDHALRGRQVHLFTEYDAKSLSAEDKRLMFQIMYGTKKPVPADIDKFVNSDTVKKEARYFFPSQLKADSHTYEVPRVKVELLPSDHPALDHTARPESPAFFTGRAAYHDLLLKLDGIKSKLNAQAVAREGGKASGAVVTPESASLVWLKKDQMEHKVGLKLKIVEYRTILSRLRELWLHPESETVRKEFLMQYLRSGGRAPNPKPKREVAPDGRAYGTGRRKTAIARVWLSKGTGVVKVNGRTAADYFPRTTDIFELLRPLRAANLVGAYDINCTVTGGGSSGQTGAIRLGLANALVVMHPELRKTLRLDGLLTRDTRIVERKKPGQKKARRKFQWVKR